MRQMWVSFLAEQFCTKFGSYRSRLKELYPYRVPIDLHANTVKPLILAAPNFGVFTC